MTYTNTEFWECVVFMFFIGMFFSWIITLFCCKLKLETPVEDPDEPKWDIECGDVLRNLYRTHEKLVKTSNPLSE